MKKILILTVAAVLAFAGCSIEDRENVDNVSQKITFANPVVSPNTRTEFGEINGKYPQGETFQAYAYWNETTFTNVTSSTIYFEDVKAFYDGTVGGFNLDPEYFWPGQGSLTFAAYSPTAAKDNGTHSYGDKGFTFTDFTIPAIGDQYDFLFSKRSYNKTKSEGGTSYNGADINFQHALSSVNFTIVNADDYGSDVVLTKVELQGISNKGNFLENVVDGSTYNSTPKWTPDPSSTTNYEIFSGTQTVSTTAAAAGTAAILLPQVFAAENTAKIVVEWKVKNVPQKAEVALNSLIFDSAAEWKIGYRYKYNIKVSLNKIYLSPEMGPWTDATGGEVNF